MKRITTIYEYRCDIFRKTIRCTEYECIETDKLYRTADRKTFATTYTSQVSKEAMPIVQENIGICVLSERPLNSEEVRLMMVSPYQKTIEHLRERISELNKKIDDIMRADYEI